MKAAYHRPPIIKDTEVINIEGTEKRSIIITIGIEILVLYGPMETLLFEVLWQVVKTHP
jgi:hypothetical protein